MKTNNENPFREEKLDFTIHRSIVVCLQRLKIISISFQAISFKLNLEDYQLIGYIKTPKVSLTSFYFDNYFLFRSTEITIIEESKRDLNPKTILHVRSFIPVDSLANSDKLKAFDLFSRSDPGLFLFIKSHDAKSQYFKNLEQEIEIGLGQVDVSLSLQLIGFLLELRRNPKNDDIKPRIDMDMISIFRQKQFVHISSKLILHANFIGCC